MLGIAGVGHERSSIIYLLWHFTLTPSFTYVAIGDAELKTFGSTVAEDGTCASTILNAPRFPVTQLDNDLLTQFPPPYTLVEQ